MKRIKEGLIKKKRNRIKMNQISPNKEKNRFTCKNDKRDTINKK